MNTEANETYRCRAAELGLSPEQVSASVLNIIETLQTAGYEAYIVGGYVRDFLLGDKPKDYDIVTNAYPEQIVRCFPRKCRVIGRRFKIVHIGYGRRAIEVSTFRAASDAASNRYRVARRDGLIIRDNQYGTLAEDVMRRDFTINSMYYDPYADMLVCHVAALEDIKQRRLRFIGVAQDRCREDPVRMIRALRLTAKNRLQIDEEIKQSIVSLAGLLGKIPLARLFEENIKWMHGGFAYASWCLLREHGLDAILFPIVHEYLQHDSDGRSHKLLKNLFCSTDDRIAAGKSVTPAFTFLTMLWPAIEARQAEQVEHGSRPEEALHQAYHEIMEAQREYIAFPYRLFRASYEICMLQHQLMSRNRRQLYEVLEHSRFRAAYDLLCYRADAGLVNSEGAQWWTRIQEVGEQEQRDMISEHAHTLKSFR